jgi:hypothetical protein
MNIDCQWIEKNLETLFSGTLSQEDQERAQQHIADCGMCGREVAALRSIDPLVKRYFQGELDRVRRASPRTVARSRLVAMSSAALIAVCVILFVALRTTHPDSANPFIVPSQAVNPPQPLDAASSVKSTSEAEIERAKPADGASTAVVQTPRAVTSADKNAPDFMVVDPAGYARTLKDYRGYIFVVEILKGDQLDAMSHFERLYKAFASNPKFRFLAVSNDRQLRPANTTFPIAYNQGSKLFGAVPGDFVLLNETGNIQLRGSLVKDFDKLELALQEKQ